MNRRFKAILLSAFVLPGLGQLYRGRKLKGGILIALANIYILAALFLAMRGLGTLMLVGQVDGRLESGKVLEAIHQDTPAGRWLLITFFCLWLYSIVDAVLDKEDNGKTGN